MKRLQRYYAFTLIEVVVAIALMAMMLGFSSVIFKTSIEAYRTAGANTEIMQKLRAITDQLRNDFGGFQENMPMAIKFKYDNINDIRSDEIAFFATGDFYSSRQYWYIDPNDNQEKLKTIRGNTASIYYGQAHNKNILVRKQKILTYDKSLITQPNLKSPDEFKIDSLAQWRVRPVNEYFTEWIFEPNIPDVANVQFESYVPMYLANNVTNFTIQLPKWVDKKLIWIPTKLDLNENLGVVFNITNWDEEAIAGSWVNSSNDCPRALKFTFTLYDSNHIIKNGKTFTYIVYNRL